MKEPIKIKSPKWKTNGFEKEYKILRRSIRNGLFDLAMNGFSPDKTASVLSQFMTALNTMSINLPKYEPKEKS